jgi:hypothetical protein
MMAASPAIVRDRMETDEPRALFELPSSWGRAGYDVSMDGDRFVMSTTGIEKPPPPPPATVILNWPALLKR